ncbi:hypothetical protein [Ruania alba]|uniref:Uncharacterized protein n=1 Tax=Ruania alba TaxID=648782 RepID=A0A1H5CU89_9MICO|nr:hypothetical protein [Ruania alba]SED70173.1 hypothetical protein SAMN04488554_0472 [Ruania alba]
MSQTIDGPTAGVLYEGAADLFHAYQGQLHALLMSVHEGEWAVGQAQYGAFAQRCPDHPEGPARYHFQYLRHVRTGRPAEEVMAQALTMLRGAGLAPNAESYGSGERAQHALIVRGDDRYAELVVSCYPATGSVRVAARTACAPGDPSELNALIFPEPRDGRIGALQPRSEGPESAPQFYFPPGET